MSSSITCLTSVFVCVCVLVPVCACVLYLSICVYLYVYVRAFVLAYRFSVPLRKMGTGEISMFQ